MKYHFTPLKGWMNDPNGLIKIDNTYHIFYQHYPHDIIWGPMHWGHATTEDFNTFNHLPIALEPDALGCIFSGNCLLDINNDSGLGENVLLAYFTHHNLDTGEEQQSLAYSYDYVHFYKYEHNPLIKNTKEMSDYKPDFRDPKVIVNPVIGGYTMILAAGESIEFYHSTNLLDWSYTGSFNAQRLTLGICECPCLFKIDDRWILTMSFASYKDENNKDYQNRHFMQYFVGEFDGYTFNDSQNCDHVLKLDYGPDNYAMVNFVNDETLMVGWGDHWGYVKEDNSTVSRGKLTSFRRVTLKNINNLYLLSFKPVTSCPSTSYIIKENDSLHLPFENDDYLKITVNDKTITVDRSHFKGNASIDRLSSSAYSTFSCMRPLKGDCHLEVYQDENYLELYFDDGLAVFSLKVF